MAQIKADVQERGDLGLVAEVSEHDKTFGKSSKHTLAFLASLH